MAEALDNPMMNQTEQHVEKFRRLEERSGGPPWLWPLRKAGLARFAELGFPTLHDEDWRFTNVAEIVKLPFHPVLERDGGGIDTKRVAELTFGRLAGRRLVFIDGHFVGDLSQVEAEEDGVIVTDLANALKTRPELLQKHLGRYALTEHNAFAALNTAFFQDGAFIYVPANYVLESPIHLLFLSTLDQPGATSHPRILVVAERQSQVTILESYAGTGTKASFTNAVTELVVADGAVVEHCKFQDERPEAFHIAAIHAQLGHDCNFISHSIAVGAKLSRNNIRTALAGDGVRCVLNGLYLTRGDQLADHHMVVEHARPHCESHEYFNGILDGRSKGVFHGRILVRQPAQKTDAKQTNKNLLLSEDATVDTKPQLEIYADDVKCTHGATIGQLNEESVFYLRARGIGAETARRMLIHAFASEIIERVRHAPVREELDEVVWERLEQNPRLAGEHAYPNSRPLASRSDNHV
jgi:Fe-S cluster assembly protein SufD